MKTIVEVVGAGFGGELQYAKDGWVGIKTEGRRIDEAPEAQVKVVGGHMTPKSPGWERAWALVPQNDYVTDFEAWQYMNTSDGVHNFRHRDFHGERTNITVPALVSDFV